MSPCRQIPSPAGFYIFIPKCPGRTLLSISGFYVSWTATCFQASPAVLACVHPTWCAGHWARASWDCSGLPCFCSYWHIAWASAFPPLSHFACIGKEQSGQCLTGTLVKANLPQGFICPSIFASQRQSGCNFSYRLLVWLLDPSLLILPLSPVVALPTLSAWVTPFKTYTQT